MKKIFGVLVDDEGRCTHYHSEVDIVANKCYECQQYFACYQCHDELVDHQFKAWPISEEFEEKIILCGFCKTELSYEDYQKNNRCLKCNHLFNENCSIHRHIYFA
ncbi:CHY zinc finger protein [Enterococcus sp. 5H]|uniref:CHY zinc finger protein n=1 Tax=Enterococcus sp. 5H TaxID=1229490 RepID=UPI0023038301|nr:CHY zinc finger protein [Enterococcus sp. 5H]